MEGADCSRRPSAVNAAIVASLPLLRDAISSLIETSSMVPVTVRGAVLPEGSHAEELFGDGDLQEVGVVLT